MKVTKRGHGNYYILVEGHRMKEVGNYCSRQLDRYFLPKQKNYKAAIRTVALAMQNQFRP